MIRHRPTFARAAGAVAVVASIAGTALGLLAAPAGADPTPATWAQLRACESSGDYTAVAGNHHYGAYQFDLPTWRSVGGTGLPSQAAPAEQDYRALYLYRMRGWQPWACARELGLHPDADAASKRAPTPTAATAPAWPGAVWSYGDCAPALRTWQLRMNHYGYHFQGTGCYYAKTKTAVLALQHANHINPSGLLGPQTWAAAWHGTAP